MKFFINKCVYLFALLLITSCNLKSQENKVDAYMANLIHDKKISGAAIAVLKDDKLIFNKNYGFADLQNEMPVTDITQFNIMSITKNFIACAVLQLADRNLINLNAPVKKYLANLPSQYDSVLIYQLLSHSAGVPDYVHVKGYMAQANRKQTPWEVLKPALNEPLEFNPGEKNAYSNSGYFLLGLLIEKVTGKRLDKFLKENIFNPVGLNNTYLDDNSSTVKLKSKGYISVNGQLKEETPLIPSQYWAAGGIVSTKADLIKWDESVINGKVLPINVINQMMQPSKLDNGIIGDYGLGYELLNDQKMKVAGNNGVGIGYNAANLKFLNDGITVIVLTNTSNGNSTMLAKNIRDIFINENENTNAATQIESDNLDTLVIQLFQDIDKANLNERYFEDTDAFNKFKKDNLSYIQSLGQFKSLEQKGEKINPQSIVRRYQLNFEKSKGNWVIIFSADGKIIIANHM